METMLVNSNQKIEKPSQTKDIGTLKRELNGYLNLLNNIQLEFTNQLKQEENVELLGYFYRLGDMQESLKDISSTNEGYSTQEIQSEINYCKVFLESLSVNFMQVGDLNFVGDAQEAIVPYRLNTWYKSKAGKLSQAFRVSLEPNYCYILTLYGNNHPDSSSNNRSQFRKLNCSDYDELLGNLKRFAI